jgi:hypothetical protein
VGPSLSSSLVDGERLRVVGNRNPCRYCERRQRLVLTRCLQQSAGQRRPAIERRNASAWYRRASLVSLTICSRSHSPPPNIADQCLVKETLTAKQKSSRKTPMGCAPPSKWTAPAENADRQNRLRFFGKTHRPRSVIAFSKLVSQA